MAEGDVRVPAGWYPDPLGLPQLRWWDNHSWTEYTSDARQPMVAQETVTQQARLAYADDDTDLTRRERRERERDGDAVFAEAATDSSGGRAATAQPKPTQETLLSLEAPVKEEQIVVEEELSPAAKFAEFVPSNAPTTPAFDLDTRFDDLLGETPVATRSAFSHVSESTTTFVPEFGETTRSAFPPADSTPIAPADASMGSPAAAQARAHGHGPSTVTGFAWVIALLPLVTLLVGMFFLVSKISEGNAILVPAIALGLPYLASLILAVFDWRTLKSRGFHPAHWGFGLLGPLYLVPRLVALVRQTGRGFGPVLGLFAFAVLNIVAIVGVPGLIISANPDYFSQTVQSSVAQDAKTLGADIIVSCPNTPPTIIGQTFVCTARQSADDPVSWGITVSLERANGWIEWRVDDWGIFTVGNAAAKG